MLPPGELLALINELKKRRPDRFGEQVEPSPKPPALAPQAKVEAAAPKDQIYTRLGDIIEQSIEMAQRIRDKLYPRQTFVPPPKPTHLALSELAARQFSRVPGASTLGKIGHIAAGAGATVASLLSALAQSLAGKQLVTPEDYRFAVETAREQAKKEEAAPLIPLTEQVYRARVEEEAKKETREREEKEKKEATIAEEHIAENDVVKQLDVEYRHQAPQVLRSVLAGLGDEEISRLAESAKPYAGVSLPGPMRISIRTPLLKTAPTKPTRDLARGAAERFIRDMKSVYGPAIDISLGDVDEIVVTKLPISVGRSTDIRTEESEATKIRAETTPATDEELIESAVASVYGSAGVSTRRGVVEKEKWEIREPRSGAVVRYFTHTGVQKSETKREAPKPPKPPKTIAPFNIPRGQESQADQARSIELREPASVVQALGQYVRSNLNDPAFSDLFNLVLPGQLGGRGAAENFSDLSSLGKSLYSALKSTHKGNPNFVQTLAQLARSGIQELYGAARTWPKTALTLTQSGASGDNFYVEALRSLKPDSSLDEYKNTVAGLLAFILAPIGAKKQ